MNDQFQEAQAEQQFNDRLQSFFRDNPGVDKPAKKFLFFSIAKPSKQYNIAQKAVFQNIKIQASYNSDGQISDGSIEYTKNGKTITLSSGLVDPPAIVVESDSDTDEEGKVVTGLNDPYFKDVEAILS
jgi:hypothetical protein